MLHWLAHALGLDSASGAYYLAWSGIAGSNIGLLAGVAIYWRTHNCHRHRCPLLGRHRVGDSNVVVCALHHPRRTSWWERIRHGRRAQLTDEAIAAIPPK